MFWGLLLLIAGSTCIDYAMPQAVLNIPTTIKNKTMNTSGQKIKLVVYFNNQAVVLLNRIVLPDDQYLEFERQIKAGLKTLIPPLDDNAIVLTCVTD